MAQVRGDALVQDLGLDRLKQPGLLRAPEPSGVHGDQDVGGAVPPFALQALDERIILALDPIDLDAGGFGEAFVELLVRLVVARAVDVQHLLLRLGGAGEERQAGHRRSRQGQGGEGKEFAASVEHDWKDSFPGVFQDSAAVPAAEGCLSFAAIPAAERVLTGLTRHVRMRMIITCELRGKASRAGRQQLSFSKG